MGAVIRIAKSGARQAPTLPSDAVTRTFGIFGTKDSGKTNTGKVLVEGICATGGHAIVFDPVGVHWGLTRAGEGPGIPGVVVGGEHGDVGLLSIDSEISAGAERLYGEMTELAPLRLTRTQLASILRRGSKSSTLTQQLSELKAAGLIEESRGQYGVANANGARGLSRDELVEWWRWALPEGPRSILGVLLTSSPVEKADLFARAGFSPTSSTPVTHLKLLRDNELAEAEGGMVRLGPALAP